MAIFVCCLAELHQLKLVQFHSRENQNIKNLNIKTFCLDATHSSLLFWSCKKDFRRPSKVIVPTTVGVGVKHNKFPISAETPTLSKH